MHAASHGASGVSHAPAVTHALPATHAPPAAHAPTAAQPLSEAYDVRLTQEQVSRIEAERAKDPLLYAHKVANAAHTYGLRCEVATPGIYDAAIEAFFLENRETPLRFPALVDPRTLLKSIQNTHGTEYQPYKPKKRKKSKAQKKQPPKDDAPDAAGKPQQTVAAKKAQPAGAQAPTAQQTQTGDAKTAKKQPQASDGEAKLQDTIRKLQAELAKVKSDLHTSIKRVHTLQKDKQVAADLKALLPPAPLLSLMQPRNAQLDPKVPKRMMPALRYLRSKSADDVRTQTNPRELSSPNTARNSREPSPVTNGRGRSSRLSSPSSTTSSLYNLALTPAQRARTPSPRTHRARKTSLSTQEDSQLQPSQGPLPFQITPTSPPSPIPSPFATPRRPPPTGRRSRTPSPATPAARNSRHSSPAARNSSPSSLSELQLSPTGHSPLPLLSTQEALSPLSPIVPNPISSPTPDPATSQQAALPFQITPISSFATPTASQRPRWSTPASSPSFNPYQGRDLSQLAEALSNITGMQPGTPMASPASSSSTYQGYLSPSSTPTPAGDQTLTPVGAQAPTPPTPTPSPAQTRSRARKQTLTQRRVPGDITPAQQSSIAAIAAAEANRLHNARIQ